MIIFLVRTPTIYLLYQFPKHNKFFSKYLQMNRENGQINYSEYQESFSGRCAEWKSEPVGQRKCNDVGCLIALAVIIVTFLGLGGYFITLYNGEYKLDSLQEDQMNLGKYTMQIVACTALSLALSFLYIFLIKLFPKILVYTMIGLTLAMLAILVVIGVIIDQLGITISAGITLLIYAMVLFCFRRKISTGIILIKVAGNFMTDRPSVFLTPIVKVILMAIVGSFWIYTVSTMLYIGNEQEAMGESSTFTRVITGVWLLYWLFFTFFFYYMMVFTIAVSCSFWYYGVDRNALITGYQWLFKYHLGTITFAAIIIAIITFLRMIADSGRRNVKNPVLAICACIVACFLRQIQALVKILNNNTIIVVSVTGESFINGAKTTIGLLSQNLPLLMISNMISSFLVFWGVIFTTGIPAIVAYLWLGGDNDDTAGVITLVFLFSIMVSLMVLSVLVESVGSVYIFYCFDRKFKEQGYSVNNMPAEIHEELGQKLGYLNQPDRSYDRM